MRRFLAAFRFAGRLAAFLATLRFAGRLAAFLATLRFAAFRFFTAMGG